MIRVAVGILLRDGKMLVAERPHDKPYGGYWEFPGGKIEKNESSLDALKRELQEELGITVLDANHWFEHIHHYPDKSVQLDLWLIPTFSGEPDGKENQALQWVTLAELTHLKVLEGNRLILERMRELFGL